jgi:hypothetical protein
MLAAVKNFIAYSSEMGYLMENYKILGHRQVRNTECPGVYQLLLSLIKFYLKHAIHNDKMMMMMMINFVGQRLFDEISTWDHFSSVPVGPNDTIIPSY